jgi:hypothetical protein
VSEDKAATEHVFGWSEMFSSPLLRAQGSNPKIEERIASVRIASPLGLLGNYG